MPQLVYVETSVPSFYFDTRTGHDMMAMCQWTREWWSLPKFDQELVIGPPVLLELSEASSPKREKALKLIEELRILPYTSQVTEIVTAYFAHKLMPREAQGDADHLALASFYNCDFLITWNCKHLANANKFGHINRVKNCWGCARQRSSPRNNYWSKTMKTKHDDGLEWLRDIRRELAKKFDYDPKKAAAHYREIQKRYASRLYKKPEHEPVEK
ncbi:MAG: type II toxin-antitoxin system VapC family toxin [Verrucomicrobiota bacterium]|nr:type II toxin-antitoxin system VapC family toxin [Verrucomicrobiota bacterium]